MHRNCLNQYLTGNSALMSAPPYFMRLMGEKKTDEIEFADNWLSEIHFKYRFFFTKKKIKTKNNKSYHMIHMLSGFLV